MGRLTPKDWENQSNEIWLKLGYIQMSDEPFRTFLSESLQKLAHYEDLEEQGRLIEVVRCKECWRYDTGAGYDGWGLCELYDQDRKDNDYCSFGELKELEGDKE